MCYTDWSTYVALAPTFTFVWICVRDKPSVQLSEHISISRADAGSRTETCVAAALYIHTQSVAYAMISNVTQNTVSLIQSGLDYEHECLKRTWMKRKYKLTKRAFSF